MATPNHKGRSLEDAVHAIEEAILATSPELRDRQFRIQPRKIVRVKGVRSEIDLHVTVPGPKGYDAVFIFECKNWKKRVGKNPIIVLKKKIEVFTAQRAFIIAQSYTRDARAEAAQDPRITLLTAEENDPALINATELFQGTELIRITPLTTLRKRGTAGTTLTQIPLGETVARINGTPVLLLKYFEHWTRLLYHHTLNITGPYPAGTHIVTGTDECHYAPGGFILNDDDIEHARVDATYHFNVINIPVISDYDVKTRGRFLRLEPFTVKGRTLQPEIVRIPRDDGSEATYVTVRVL